jgi:hypothetical protein
LHDAGPFCPAIMEKMKFNCSVPHVIRHIVENLI